MTAEIVVATGIIAMGTVTMIGATAMIGMIMIAATVTGIAAAAAAAPAAAPAIRRTSRTILRRILRGASRRRPSLCNHCRCRRRRIS